MEQRVKVLVGKDKGKYGRIMKRLNEFRTRITTDDGFRIILWNDEFEYVKENENENK